jgi:uncharacterized protein involved in exopolysaccharide biosynthesis
MNEIASPCIELENETGSESPIVSCSTTASRIENDSVSIVEYLRIILKHKRMIFWFCTIIVATTAIVSMLLPKYYAAIASVVTPIDVLQRESVLAYGLGVVKNPILQKAMDVSSVADMYVGILKSRSIADALIERFDLASAYGFKKDVAAVRKTLEDRTSIKVTDEGIVQITVEDTDPCRAAFLANAYVEELDRQNKRLFVGQAVSKKIFLENRLREIEGELSQIDNLLSRDAKIKEILFEMLTREYEIAKIEEAKSMPTIQILDKAVVPEKKCKPRRAMIVMLAGTMGIFISVLAAFARERLTPASLA